METKTEYHRKMS